MNVNRETAASGSAEAGNTGAPRSVSGERKIIHVDMDAFFASVEQRDNPALRGRPVIVGGDPRGRGVVAACSYEARAFGVHSAMPSARALRLCPEAIIVRPDHGKYRRVSAEIRAVFHRYTHLVEPLSLDEAFLDVTGNRMNIPSATWIAARIKREILATTGLTASAGVSCNKFLAKIASDMDKPDGLTVIEPHQALAFIHRLPVGRFHGVGRVTEKRMHALGIRTGADLHRYGRDELVTLFGRAGAFFHDIVRGIDPRPVRPHRQRRSMGAETTLRRDTGDLRRMMAILAGLADRVGAALESRRTCGRTLVLKVRYDDFTTVTRSRTPGGLFLAPADIMAHVPGLLAATEAGRRKVRLLGITVTNLVGIPAGRPLRQLVLPFHDPNRLSGRVSVQ